MSILFHRVLFPASVSWVVLEMDPRSVTAQPEDTLTVYAVGGSSGSNCHCNSEVRTTAPPFRKVYKVESLALIINYSLLTSFNAG